MRVYVLTGLPPGAQAIAARRAEENMLQRFAAGQKRGGPEQRRRFGGPGSLRAGGQHIRVRGQRVQLVAGAQARDVACFMKKQWEAEGLIVTLRRYRLRSRA